MVEIKGMGVCLVSDDEGIPCSKQIEEGSPIGTVLLPTGPAVAHKKCADAFYARKMRVERENRENMVKLAKQGGPGGAVDMSQAEDAIENPSPLEKPVIDQELVQSPPFVPRQPVDFSQKLEPGVYNEQGGPFDLTGDEQAALKEFKQKLLDARAGMVTEEVGKAIAHAEAALAGLRQAAIKLADAYDKAIAERDEARSQRDTSQATSS